MTQVTGNYGDNFKFDTEFDKHMLLLFKSGINLLTRFGKTNPINFDKNLNSISGSLSNKKAA